MANKQNDVDTRIVEMQFDSKDFDKNIRKSQKNLDDFKKSLNFDKASKQMQGFAGSMQEFGDSTGVFANMAKNIQKLAKEFTGIGSIGTYIAQKIKSAWQGALGSVESFAKSLTTVQQQVGHEKYDKLLKSVQTIKNATGEAESVVYDVMGTLNKYTDETSYDFADMAANIGKFTTAGVKLRDAEEEMEGIANWAALAGQGVQEAQRAMYNISQAMSAGYMLKVDYRSIQNANMDIRKFREEAIKAAVAAGTLVEKGGKFYTKKGNKNVTLDNFAETLQFKWFDKASMEKVFKTFADNTQGIGKEAYIAAQRCVTFSDALNAIKDMLSTGWMQSYQFIFGKLSDAMALFSGMCIKAGDALYKFVEIRNGILEHWSHTGRDSLWAALVGEIENPDGGNLFKGAYGLLDLVTDLGGQIEEALWDFVKRFVNPLNMEKFENESDYRFEFIAAGLTMVSNKIRDFTTSMRSFFNDIPEGATESRFDQIRHVVEAIFATVTLIAMVIKGIGQFGSEIIVQLRPATTAITYLLGYLSQMLTGKVASAAKKNTIGNFFHQLAEMLRPVTYVINRVVIALVNLIGKTVEFLDKSGLMNLARKAFQKFGEAIANAFVPVAQSGALDQFTNWIQNLSTKLPGAVSKLKAFAKSLKNTVKNSKAFQAISGWIKSALNKDSLKGVWNSVSAWVSSIDFSGGAKSVMDAIKKAIESFFGAVLNMFVSTAKADASDAIADAVTTAIVPGADGNKASLISKVKDKLSGTWDGIKTAFTDFFKGDLVTKIKGFFSGTTFKELLGGATQFLKFLTFFKGASAVGKVGSGIKSLGKGIKVFGKNLKNLNLANIFSGMFNISNVVNSNNVTKNGTNWSNFGKQILMIAGAIGVLTLAAVKLASMKPDELKQAGIALGAMIGGLLAAGFAAKKLAGNGGSLLALAAALTLLLVPFKVMQHTELSDVVENTIKLFGVIAAIALGARIAGTVKIKGLVGMATAVNLLMIPIAVLGKMPLPQLLQGGITIAAVIFSLAGAARVTGGLKMAGMLGMAVALNLLLIPIKTLANMDIYKMAQGVMAIEVLILSLGGLAVAAGGKKVGSLAGVVLAIAALSAIAALIAGMGWKKALTGFAPIILLISSIAALMAFTSKMSEKAIGKVALVFGLISVMVAAIAGSIVLITKTGVDWKMLATFMAGIIGTVVVVGAAIAILGRMSPAGVAYAVVGITAAVAALMGVVALMAPLVIGSIGASIEKLSAKLKLISMMLRDFFDNIDKISEESVAHAKAIFDGMHDIIDKFSGFGDMEADILSIRRQLSALGTGVELFFVNDSKYPDPKNSKTFATLERLLELGPQLSTLNIGNLPSKILYLGTSIGMFNSATKDIATDKIPALELLTKLFEQTDNITAFAALPLDDFTSMMSGFGGAMSLYAKGASEVTGVEAGDEASISGALNILKAVCAAVTGEDGSGEFKIPENLPNPMRLGLFAGQLSALGLALSGFATAAKEMNTDTDNAMALMKFLAEIGGYLTKDNLESTKVFEEAGVHGGEGGILDQFALDIGALGMALSSFADNIKEKSFSSGLNALEKFAKIKENLTVTNLEAAKAFTEAGIHKDELDVFADDIGALGRALSSFADNVAGKDFDNGLKSLNFLVALQNRMMTVGGLAGLIEGNKLRIGALADDLLLIGSGIAGMYNSITGVTDTGAVVNFEVLDGALSFLNSLVGIMNAMNTINPETGDLYGAAHYIFMLGDIMNAITDQNSFYGVTPFATKIIEFASQLSEAYGTIGQSIDPEAIDIFLKISEALNNMFSMADYQAQFEYPGEMISKGLAQGILNGESTVIQSVIDVVTAAIAAGTSALGITSGTISPVVDMSNVEDASAGIQASLGGSYQLDIEASLRNALNAMFPNGVQEVIVQNPFDPTTINESIKELNEQISTLDDSIKQMRLYLDTGALIGGITEGIDDGIGRRGMYFRRRN